MDRSFEKPMPGEFLRLFLLKYSGPYSQVHFILGFEITSLMHVSSFIMMNIGTRLSQPNAMRNHLISIQFLQMIDLFLILNILMINESEKCFKNAFKPPFFE